MSIRDIVYQKEGTGAPLPVLKARSMPTGGCFREYFNALALEILDFNIDVNIDLCYIAFIIFGY
jgi:hypothetical protein